MSKVSLPKLSPGMILFLVVVGMAIMSLFSLLILPNQASMKRMDQEIDFLKSEVKVQEVLNPFFRGNLPESKAYFDSMRADIEKRLDHWKANIEAQRNLWISNAGNIPMPPAGFIFPDKMQRISYDLFSAAEGSGFVPERIEVGEKSYSFDWNFDVMNPSIQYRPVNISFSGKLENLTSFFAWFDEIPYIRYVESFDARYQDHSFLFEMKIWISVARGAADSGVRRQSR